MFEPHLHDAVAGLAALAHSLEDHDLDRDWAWGAYNEEGVRFAFFRTYEVLREVAALTDAARAGAGLGATSAQRILAQYHAAYRDLQAALLGLDESALNQAPAEGEWPVKRTVAHMASVDGVFQGLVAYALNRYRGGGAGPLEISEEAWDGLLGYDEAAYDAMLEGPYSGLGEYHADVHDRILAQFASITEEELAAPSMFWEGYPLSLRFRLHRFDSHLRQHTVQVDRTLEATGRGPNETARLVRLIYSALAEAEGASIGAWDVAAARRRLAAREIAARTAQIAVSLAG